MGVGPQLFSFPEDPSAHPWLPSCSAPPPPQYLVGERVLLEVVGLHKLHAALGTNVRTDVLVFHHVILKLARVLEGLVTLRAVILDGAPMRSEVSLQLSQGGEVETALHTNVLAPAGVLGLMGLELAGVGKAPAAHATVVWLYLTMLHHVALQVTGLGEGLVAHLAFVGPRALVCQHVGVQMAELLEELPTAGARMWLDPTVAQDVGHQVVLGGVGFVTSGALPALLRPTHVHVVTVINLDIHVHPLHLLLGLLALQGFHFPG